VFHGKLGEYFEAVREAKKQAEGDHWSLRGAASLAKRKGLQGLTYQILFRLEAGQIRHVAPAVLRAVADLYGLVYEDIVAMYVSSEYGLGRDLHRQSRTRGSALHPGPGGVIDGSTTARVRELEGRIEELRVYESIVRHLRPLLAEALAAVGTEGHPAAAPASKSRRRH